MNTKSEKDSKNGIFTKTKNNFLNTITRSTVSFILLAASFCAMSFNKADAPENNTDTNLNKTKTATVQPSKMQTCCAQAFIPGDEIKKSLLQTKYSAKQVAIADQENAKIFARETSERSTWSMSLSRAQKKADEETFFNFQLSKLNPENAVAQRADESITIQFVEAMVLNATFKTSDYARLADAAIINQFLTEQFAITISRSLVAADMEVQNQFQR